MTKDEFFLRMDANAQEIMKYPGTAYTLRLEKGVYVNMKLEDTPTKGRYCLKRCLVITVDKPVDPENPDEEIRFEVEDDDDLVYALAYITKRFNLQ